MQDKERSLDKKYRPHVLETVRGNESLIESLTSILARDTGIPSAFLFQGPTGCGKTTLARILAIELGGTLQSIQELNISNMTGVDTAREIIKKSKYAPFGGKKIYILNECHKASNSFQNAILEILEEPPSHLHFILCTTEPEKLLKTVKGRCTIYQVKKLPQREIIKLLSDVLQAEDIDLTEPFIEAIREIAKVCEGEPRQALVWLDTIIDIEDDVKMFEVIQNFSAQKQTVIDLYNAVKGKHSWNKTAKIIRQMNDEPEKVRHAILTMANKDLLRTGNIRLFDIIEAFKQPFYVPAQLTAKCFELFMISGDG